MIARLSWSVLVVPTVLCRLKKYLCQIKVKLSTSRMPNLTHVTVRHPIDLALNETPFHRLSSASSLWSSWQQDLNFQLIPLDNPSHLSQHL